MSSAHLPPTVRHCRSWMPRCGRECCRSTTWRAGRAGLPQDRELQCQATHSGVGDRGRSRDGNVTTQDRFRLDGKVAVVTGAAGLLGRSHCATLADAGAMVVATDLDGEKCDEVVCGLAGDAMEQRPTSPTADRWRDCVAAVLSSPYGRVDILINNAAINDMFESPAAAGELSMFENYPVEMFRRSLEVNVTGTFLCSSLGNRYGARRIGEHHQHRVDLRHRRSRSVALPKAGWHTVVLQVGSLSGDQGSDFILHPFPCGILGQSRRTGQCPLSPGGVENGQRNFSRRTTRHALPLHAWRHPTTTAALSSSSPAMHRHT